MTSQPVSVNGLHVATLMEGIVSNIIVSLLLVCNRVHNGPKLLFIYVTVTDHYHC